MSRHQIISPEEIQRQIAQGDPVVIYEGHALHLGEWINSHPGGKLAILHMVGRDATDEINMYVMRAPLNLYVPARCQPRRLWKSRKHTMSPDRCGRVE
jgi:cytochrome b involved in lipid metabolism